MGLLYTRLEPQKPPLFSRAAPGGCVWGFFCASQDAQREMTSESVPSREEPEPSPHMHRMMTTERARWSEAPEMKMGLIAGVRGQSVPAGRSSPLQADKQVIC